MQNIEFKKNLNIELPISSSNKQLEMIWLNSGTFCMGYNETPKLILHDRSFEMTLSKGFWLGKFMITQVQWQAVMGGNPSIQKGDDLPVDCISWSDASIFCEKLNFQNKNILPSGYKFSLPTEAQWEYACRAKTQLKNYSGNDPEDTLKIAWCLNNSENQLHEVGLKEPNLWGFYDMFGNLYEWCFDMITDYPLGKASDWIGLTKLGFDGGCSRIIRGGCYLDSVTDDAFSSACRPYVDSDIQQTGQGFRLSLRTVDP
jgi:formylglycine-generating enzyme required for sulfatase activity